MPYVNPFEILGLKPEDLSGLDSGLLKKSKKRLLAEIELSNNKSISYYGINLTKSEIIKIIDELDYNDKKYFHQYIFQNKNLLKFLTKNDVSFLNNYKHDSIFNEKAFIDFISLFFADKYNEIFFDAFVSKDVSFIRKIANFSPLVTSKDTDNCYKKIYNHIEGLISKIENITSRIKSNNNTSELNYYEDAENILGELHSSVLNPLPQYFQAIRNKLAKTAGNLSIGVFNHLDNSKLAVDLLKHAIDLKISEYHRKKLEVDLNQIEEINNERIESERYENDLKKYAGLLQEIGKLIENTESKSINIDTLLARLHNVISVNELNNYPGLFDQIRNSIAVGLRELAVSIWNNYTEINTSISILKIALEIRVDNETKKYLGNEYNEILIIRDDYFRYLENQKREHRKEQFKKIAWGFIAVIVIVYLSTIDESDNSSSSNYSQSRQTTPNYYNNSNNQNKDESVNQYMLRGSLRVLKSKIDNAKQKIDDYEKQLITIEQKMNQYEKNMSSLDIDIKQYESKIKLGQYVNEQLYNSKINSYNNYVNLHNAALKNYNTLYAKYKAKITVHDNLVEEYNIKR